MGIFCRFGSLELSRPVAVPVCEKLVCRRPVSGWMSFGSASTYVDLSLAISRYSMIFAGSGCCADSSSRISTAVDLALALQRRERQVNFLVDAFELLLLNLRAESRSKSLQVIGALAGPAS